MMRAGESYRCADPECGCEVEVVKGSELERAAANPRCCCGKEMVRQQATRDTAIEGEARAS